MVWKDNVYTAAIVFICLLCGFCYSIPQKGVPPIKKARDTPLAGDSNSTVLPFYDLIVAVPITDDESVHIEEKVARTQENYQRYVGGEIHQHGSETPLTFKLVFIVNKTGLPMEVQLSGGGLLVGDFFYVNIPSSNTYDAEMTKAMVALLDHLDFRFMAKADTGTFPCLSAVTQKLITLPPRQQTRVYAGKKTICGLVYPKGHPLYDPDFGEITEDALKCHPVFHQGAFYVLGIDLVRYLNQSRDLLKTMTVADAMVGSWLLGIEKVIVDLPGMLHFCPCDYKHVGSMFFHGCTSTPLMDACIGKLGEC